MAVVRSLTKVVILFLLISCNNNSTDTVTDIDILKPQPGYGQWWFDRHNSIIANLKPNQKIVFIGDSITQEWELHGKEAWQEMQLLYNNQILNHGIGGDGIAQVLWRLENGEFPSWLEPEYVVLMIGTNNNEPPKIVEGIDLILKHIQNKSPTTKVLLFSLLPTGDFNHTIKNDTVNQMLKSSYTNYIDIFSYYINSDWTIKYDLFVDDNPIIIIHISLAGYNIWKEEIIKAVL